jgi:Tol biopolymer transport system component
MGSAASTMPPPTKVAGREAIVGEGRRNATHAHANWRRAWLVVGLAAWAEIGVALVDRANQQGLVQDITFSPYHLVAYAALLALGVYAGIVFFRGLRHGHWRDAFPPHYGGLGLGFAFLVAWIGLDIVWRNVVGINAGIEDAFAPPRLLVPVALILIAIGPARDAIAARAERGLDPGEIRVRWAGVLAIGLACAPLTLGTFSEVREPLQDFAIHPGADRSEIWTMAADGSGQTRVLPALGDGVDYSLPAWSPDGKRIAYTVWTNKGGAAQNIANVEQTAAIWTMAADGSDRKLVVDGAPDDAQDWIAAWSPDGRWIAYSRSLNHPTTPAPKAQPNAGPQQLGSAVLGGGSSIWIVPANGGTPQRLTDEGTDAVVGSWSPDGSKLAYTTGSGGNSDVYVASINVLVSALTGASAVAADPANDWGPAWSPDGSQLAFVSNRSGIDQVWVVQADDATASPVQVTDGGSNAWVPAFSPDGKRIVFVSDRDGEPEVWSMTTNGSDQVNLTNHPQAFDGQWSVSWSTDGTRIAYATGGFGDAATSGWVRDDLAVAKSLFFAVALAIMALLIVALGAPVGAFGLATALVVGLAAIPEDQWRLIPATVIAGLLVDLLVRAVRPAVRARASAAALPALVNLAIGLTIGAGGNLAWSTTLLLGVAMASAVIGWGLAEVVGRILGHAPDVVAHAAPGEG